MGLSISMPTKNPISNTQTQNTAAQPQSQNTLSAWDVDCPGICCKPDVAMQTNVMMNAMQTALQASSL